MILAVLVVVFSSLRSRIVLTVVALVSLAIFVFSADFLVFLLGDSVAIQFVAFVIACASVTTHIDCILRLMINAAD